MKHNVYLFSGLGADERVFKHITFPKSQICHIKWPKVTKETHRDSFLSEVAAQINTKKNNVFLGVSFGGLIAQDIAALLPVDKLILVSSVAEAAEIPCFYKSSFSSLLLRVTPSFLLNRPNPLISFMFSVKTNDGRRALHDIIQDTDPVFLRWAIAYLKQWIRPTSTKAKQMYRIHGAKDRVFPKINQEAGVKVVSGGHFAIYESSSEINGVLKSWL